MAEEFFCGADAQQLVSESPTDPIQAWVKGSDGRITTVPVSAEHALALYGAGHSLYFRAPAEACDVLARAMGTGVGLHAAGLHADGAAKGEVEVFVTRAGHVTDWHTDFMENWTVQLRGCKEWDLERGPVRHPIRGITPHYAAPEVVEQQAKTQALQAPMGEFSATPRTHTTVRLEPGDVMYFPAGTRHRVRCTADSLSVNISLVASNWSDTIASALRMAMWRKTPLRALVCGRSATDMRAAAAGALREAIRSLQALQPEELAPPCLLSPGLCAVDLRWDGSDLHARLSPADWPGVSALGTGRGAAEAGSLRLSACCEVLRASALPRENRVALMEECMTLFGEAEEEEEEEEEEGCEDGDGEEEKASDEEGGDESPGADEQASAEPAAAAVRTGSPGGAEAASCCSGGACREGSAGRKRTERPSVLPEAKRRRGGRASDGDVESDGGAEETPEDIFVAHFCFGNDDVESKRRVLFRVWGPEIAAVLATLPREEAGRTYNATPLEAEVAAVLRAVGVLVQARNE